MDKQSTIDAEQRRIPPATRFAGDSHSFDLPAVVRTLRAEAHPATHGHRQVTIFQRAPVTHIVFAFEPGAELADYATNGFVTIHALEGRLAVHAAGHDHELSAGMVLILNPDVRHNLRALESSALLLTIQIASET